MFLFFFLEFQGSFLKRFNLVSEHRILSLCLLGDFLLGLDLAFSLGELALQLLRPLFRGRYLEFEPLVVLLLFLKISSQLFVLPLVLGNLLLQLRNVFILRMFLLASLTNFPINILEFGLFSLNL